MGIHEWKSRNVRMESTTENICDAIKIADLTISTEIYDFSAIQYLALRGLEEVKQITLNGHQDSAEFITMQGVELTISSGDAQHLMECGYPWSIDGGGSITFTEKNIIKEELG